MNLIDHSLYGLSWILFGILHSALASQSAKHQIGQILRRFYRLTYNGIALFLTLFILWMGEQVLGAESIIFFPSFFSLNHDTSLWQFLRIGFIILGSIILIGALAGYDGSRFLGFRQLQNPKADDDSEPLSLTGMNKYCRHPLYTGSMIVLWARASTEAEYATAFWISLYFIIGARLEEKRLQIRFGQDYKNYQQKVAAFIPGFPWFR